MSLYIHFCGGYSKICCVILSEREMLLQAKSGINLRHPWVTVLNLYWSGRLLWNFVYSCLQKLPYWLSSLLKADISSHASLPHRFKKKKKGNFNTYLKTKYLELIRYVLLASEIAIYPVVLVTANVLFVCNTYWAGRDTLC